MSLETPARRRVVLLGGGFSDDPDTVVDDYLLSVVGKPNPKILFLPTASGDSKGYIERFYVAFGQRQCRPAHLELFRRSVTDISALLLEQDVIYVGGGNTANMLAVWRLHGVDAALRAAYDSGVVLTGLSAGAACWFEGYLSDSLAHLSPRTDGLGLLSGSFCPHADSEADRRHTFSQAVSTGALAAGYALDDGTVAVFADQELVEARAREHSTIRFVRRDTDGSVAEDRLSTRTLG